MWKIVFTKYVLKDLPKLKSAHIDGKVKKLLEVIKEDPFKNPPPYEKLTGDLSGAYSRRINLQHRFVYQVINETFERDGVQYEGYVKILSVWTHYERN